MNIDRRVTNGLAWAGVLLVVGIPAADFVTGKFFSGSPSNDVPRVAVVEPVTGDTAPVPAPLSQRPDEAETVAAVPAKPVVTTPAKTTQPATQSASAVDNWVNSGKALPSYITGGTTQSAPPAQAATTSPVRTPIVTTPAAAPAPVQADPVQVASIPEVKVAPVPMPLSMRPRPITVPLATAPSASPLIVPSTAVVLPNQNNQITAEDLDDWESGPLSEFLARRQAQSGRAPVGVQSQGYNEGNGFFLDQVPNNVGRDRLIGPANDYFAN